MPILAHISAALAWLGRQRARAVAATVIIALAVPPVDVLFRPFVTEAVFALLCIAFLRVDAAALRGHMKRPGLIIAATAWSSLAVPIVFGVCGLLLHLNARTPEIFLALMLQAVASPMMAAPAFAALLGLDATLVLTTLVTSTALTPFSAPLFAYLFVGPTMLLSPLALGLKLMAILVGSIVIAALVRRFAGAATIRRYDDQIDGLNILLVFTFVAAVMQDVAGRFLADPVMMLELTAAAFAITFAVLGLTALVFIRAGAERSFVIGLMASQRNMGLMLAATGGMLPGLTWLYFALAQFPVYLSPLLLSGLARRVKKNTGKTDPAP